MTITLTPEPTMARRIAEHILDSEPACERLAGLARAAGAGTLKPDPYRPQRKGMLERLEHARPGAEATVAAAIAAGDALADIVASIGGGAMVAPAARQRALDAWRQASAPLAGGAE